MILARTSATGSEGLLLLLDVLGVLTQARAVLAEFQLRRAGLLKQRVVTVAAFLTDEEDDFSFLLGLSHDAKGSASGGAELGGPSRVAVRPQISRVRCFANLHRGLTSAA